MSQIDYQALNDRLHRAFIDNVKDADLANDIAQLRELVSEKVRIQQLEGEVAGLRRAIEKIRDVQNADLWDNERLAAIDSILEEVAPSAETNEG